jgi:hypothetical protein
MEFEPEMFFKPKATEADSDRKPYYALADYPQLNSIKNLNVNSSEVDSTTIPPTINSHYIDAKKVSHGKLRLIDNRDEVDCPIKKEGGFPCPRCKYSVSTSRREEFLNTTTWWYCQYPNQDKFVTP